MPVSFNKFNSFTEDLAKKVHNLGSDDLRVYLTNTLPVATNTVYNTPADLTTGGGYTAGGAAASITSCVQTSGTLKLILVDITWTATTGFGPFQYAVLYNNTAALKQLIGWYNYGSAVTLGASETFTVDFDGSAGVLTIG